MKRLIAASSLTVIIIICAVSGVWLTQKYANEFNLIADECMQSYYSSQSDSLKKVILLKEKVKKYQPLLFLFSNRETVEELEDAVCKMEYSLNSGNELQFLEEYYNTNMAIRKLKEAQRLSLESFL